MPSFISKDVSTSDQVFEERDTIADLILSACDEHDANEVIDVLIRSRWEREPLRSQLAILRDEIDISREEQSPAPTGWETVDTSIPREESEVR